jgi:hypothetical protein
VGVTYLAKFPSNCERTKDPKDETLHSSQLSPRGRVSAWGSGEAMSWSLSVCVVALLATVLAAAQSASSTEPAPWWAWGTSPYALEVPTDMAQLCDAIWAQGSTSQQPAQFALARAQVCGVQSGTLSGRHCLSVRLHLPSCAAITWPLLTLGLFGQHGAHFWRTARTCMHCTNIAASVDHDQASKQPCRHPIGELRHPPCPFGQWRRTHWPTVGL